MTSLRVSPEAEEELAAAADWYEGRRPGLGAELVAEIDRAFEDLIASPLACALWRNDRPYRRKLLHRFPYVIFFRIDGETIRVDAIAHVRRRPGYWIGRSRT